jgi:hypothetical protein
MRASRVSAVGEFMLNLCEINDAPTRQEVEAYVQAHFCHGGRVTASR